jgi:hypothetical protein
MRFEVLYVSKYSTSLAGDINIDDSLSETDNARSLILMNLTDQGMTGNKMVEYLSITDSVDWMFLCFGVRIWASTHFLQFVWFGEEHQKMRWIYVFVSFSSGYVTEFSLFTLLM